jgi:putative SOS response-associated peptidase YedK
MIDQKAPGLPFPKLEKNQQTGSKPRCQIIEEHFDSVSGEDDWSPRYNIAPTQPIPVIRQNPEEPVRELWLLRWGLIPSCHGRKTRLPPPR